MPIYNDNKKYYTNKEVAELLNLTVGSITKFVAAKKLKGQIVAGKRTFTEEQIKDFLLQRFPQDTRSLSLEEE